MTKKIFITGISGTVGTILSDALSPIFEIDGIDANIVDSNSHNMTHLDSCYKFFENADVVIDLAATADQYADWTEIYQNNFLATRNAFEASRMAGVKKFIFASSNHGTGMYEGDEPYSSIVSGDYEDLDSTAIPYVTSSMPVRPDGPYGIAKVFGEAVGRQGQ